MNYTQIETELIHDEGVRLRAYKCSKGHLTIGVGHKLTPHEIRAGLNEISMERAGQILHHDIGIAVSGCYGIFGRWRFDGMSEPRQHALVNMCFQLGTAGLAGFEDMVAAIMRDDWETAHKEALNSKWAKKDSPKRARRVAAGLLIGD